MMDTPSTNAANTNVVMAVLAYIGILVLISYIVAKDDPFVRFHIKQGLVLLVIELASGFLTAFMLPLLPLLEVINLGVVILVVIGIMHVAQGKQEPLPLVGGLAHYFNI